MQVFERSIYRELKRIARRQRRGLRGPGTLSIVHAAYVKMAASARSAELEREHFNALAARTMRQVVVDHARSRGRLKRGGDRKRVDLRDDQLQYENQLSQVLSVDRALDELAATDPQLVKVVEAKYFCGMTEEEIAASLGVTPRTVRRQWRLAKGRLQSVLAS